MHYPSTHLIICVFQAQIASRKTLLKINGHTTPLSCLFNMCFPAFLYFFNYIYIPPSPIGLMAGNNKVNIQELKTH